MYVKHFGLVANPFHMTPDPHYLFLTPAHREALAGLIYSVVKRRGISVLIGEAGTGKTTLLRTMLESVPHTLATFGLVVHPTVSSSEFLEMLLLDLGIEQVPESKTRRLEALHRFLIEQHSRGKVVVLVLDEAHKLSPELLEEVRLLTNLENSQGKLVQIVLSGQSELDEILARQDLRQLKQRVAYRFMIRPLAADDVGGYVGYRWTQAGGHAPHPFGEDTIDYLAWFSAGVPRVINALCDNALVLAYSDGAHEVRPEHMIAVAKDLAWDTEQGRGLAAPEYAPAEPPLAHARTSGEAPIVFPTLERCGSPQKPTRFRRWSGVRATPVQ